MPDRSFAEQLSPETEAWVAEGLLSAEQAEAIRRRYEGTRARPSHSAVGR